MEKVAREATPVERTAKFSHGLKDALLHVPAKVTMDAMHQALNGMEWPHCFSRGNVGPGDVAFIEATPVGLIEPYFRGVCLSRFTKANPNMTKMLLGFPADEARDNDEGRP